MTKVKQAELFSDSAKGIYIPQHFAESAMWIVWSQNAIDAINEHCESQLEYETSHRDAGYGYAHLVGECLG